jgi:phospholipase D1/2
MYWQYVSISRGGRSIIEELQKAGIDASQYISFFALRSYDRINRNHVEQMLSQVAGYSSSEVQAAGASQRPEERRAEFIQEGEPDFVRGTEASVMHQHPLQNFEDRMERAVNYTRVPEEEEGKKILDEAVHMARHNYAKDSVGRDAMEGGDLDNESWVDDTATSRPRDQAAETDEAADYVTEELYIHAKTMIIDGKYILVHIQSVDRDG